jgi:hypothetical protein
VDVVFPRGLGMLNPGGAGMEGLPALWHLGVSLCFEARPIDDYGTPIGDWFTLVAPYYSNATQTAQRFTHIVNVPPGRYQVRGYCTGGGEENQYYLNEVSWVSLKAYLPSKLIYPDITLIAVRILATNALSQQSSRLFHVLLTRKLPIWNPYTGWSAPQPTNSWAWAMAAMCKAPWGGRRTDRQIDLNALYRLDQELAARGDEFCHVLDTRQIIWDLFRDACRCVRALPRALGSTISWMRDGADRPVRGVFTPYNIVRDSFGVDYKFFTDDSPDDVMLDYVDRDNWMARDVHARLPDSLSMEPARKRFMGITSRAQAYREACFEVACNEYRRIFLKWATELEGRLLFRGDMVLVTHPLGGEDRFAGVRGWNESTRTLLLDTSLPWDDEHAGRYYVVLRRPNGTPHGPVKVAGVGEKSLTLDAASLETAEAGAETPLWQWLSDGRAKDATAVIYGKEAPGLRAIILSVKPRQNGQCEVEAVVEDERVHTADAGEVPPWTPGGEVPVAAMRPAVTGLTASYDYATAALALSWMPEAAARGYQVQYRSYDTWEVWVPDSVLSHYETVRTENGGEMEVPVYLYPAHWETRSGWSEWNDLGEASDPARTFTVPQRLVEYRVRGLSDVISGLWTTRQADCAAAMPGTVELSLSAPYAGGNLSLDWPGITAESIRICLRSGGIERFSKTVAGSGTSAAVAASEVQGISGPWRTLEVYAVSKNSTWEVRSLTLEVADAPPAVVQGLEVTVTASVASLSWQAASGEVTGYVVGHQDNFGEVHRAATTDTSMDIPVGAGTHRFTVAAKDALYDILHDDTLLNFCPLVEVSL